MLTPRPGSTYRCYVLGRPYVITLAEAPRESVVTENGSETLSRRGPHRETADTIMNICLRFITDGIRDTVDYYRRDNLPLHRLSWELRHRIDALASHAPTTWIDQLRDLQRRVEEVHDSGQSAELSELQHAVVNESLRQLQVVLERATP
jgi:hypothetical protein